MKIRRTVRLYRHHDLDLIVLYKTTNIRFVKTLKAVLLAKANGTEYKFRVPEGKPVCDTAFKYAYRIFVFFDDTDADDVKILNFIDTIKSGQWNSYFRMAMREAICGDLKYAYMASDDARIAAIAKNESLEIPNEKLPPIKGKRKLKKDKKGQASKSAQTQTKATNDNILSDKADATVNMDADIDASAKAVDTTSQPDIKSTVTVADTTNIKDAKAVTNADVGTKDVENELNISVDTDTDSNAGTDDDFDFFGNISNMMQQFY